MKVALGPFLLVAAVAWLGGCHRRAPAAEPFCGPVARVLVVSAFDDEIEPLLAQTAVSEQAPLEAGPVACGVLAGRDVALMLSGVGPARARRSVQLALERMKISSVVFVGIAGGVGRNLRVGDVVIPDRWSRHDQPPPWYPSTDSLLRVAKTMAAPSLAGCDDAEVCAPVPSLTIGGNGITGAKFVADPAVASDLQRRLEASVTDMETAVVAELAQGHAIPFIAIRGVSDVVSSGRSRRDVERHQDLAAHNAAAVAIRFLGSAS
jgi:adenosylhomocysteine nucleosidase